MKTEKFFAITFFILTVNCLWAQNEAIFLEAETANLGLDSKMKSEKEVKYVITKSDYSNAGYSGIADQGATVKMSFTKAGIELDSIAVTNDDQEKFLGSCYASNKNSTAQFITYWNQVTAENAGKWGSVEGTRNQMNWTELDKAYHLAKDNGLSYKHHVLVWGDQQPNWMKSLDSTQQRKEILEWFQAVAKRYPNMDQLEVVNEPLHSQPTQERSGGYKDALGGDGESGWDWILEAFRMADTIFPQRIQRLINDYNIMNSTESTDKFFEIVKLLQAEDLVDGVGFQAHGFSHTASNSTYLRNMDKLSSTGLPLYITELDINGKTDIEQVHNYMNLFPLLWEHPAVKGITLWGYTQSMWRSAHGAYLLVGNTERPAMQWLKAYVNNSFVPNEAISVTSVSGDTVINEIGGKLQLQAEVLPDTTTLKTVIWSVSPSTMATISDKGLLTAKKEGKVVVTASSMELGSKVKATKEITIKVPVSVNSLSDERKVKIFPNPSVDGRFTIDGIENIKQIKVFNLNGTEILNEVVFGNSTYEIKIDAGRGIYFVMLTDGATNYYEKISIK